MNFQDDIPSISNDTFKDDYVIVFDLTSMQDASENFHYPELIGEPLRLKLNRTSALEQVFLLTILGKQMSFFAVDKVGLVANVF